MPSTLVTRGAAVLASALLFSCATGTGAPITNVDSVPSTPAQRVVTLPHPAFTQVGHADGTSASLADIPPKTKPEARNIVVKI